MASPATLYQQEMHSNLGFFATWLPADGIEVGDVGLFEAGKFRRMTSLRDLRTPVKTRASEIPQDLQYTSTHGTRVSAGGGAMIAGVAGTEITIEFSKQGAFIFHAAGLRSESLENRAAVTSKILESYRQGEWDKKWLVVDGVHYADCATIVVSEERSAALVLAADVAGAVPGVWLADPNVGLRVTSTRGRMLHVVGGRGLHPLYSCLRLVDPLFRQPSVHPVRGQDSPVPDSSLVRPAIDELVTS